MTGQFTPLTSFLERANRETVELTFDELEDVLGRPSASPLGRTEPGGRIADTRTPSHGQARDIASSDPTWRVESCALCGREVHAPRPFMPAPPTP